MTETTTDSDTTHSDTDYLLEETCLIHHIWLDSSKMITLTLTLQTQLWLYETRLWCYKTQLWLYKTWLWCYKTWLCSTLMLQDWILTVQDSTLMLRDLTLMLQDSIWLNSDFTRLNSLDSDLSDTTDNVLWDTDTTPLQKIINILTVVKTRTQH